MVIVATFTNGYFAGPLDGGIFDIRVDVTGEIVRRPHLHLELENGVPGIGRGQAFAQSGAQIIGVGNVR